MLLKHIKLCITDSANTSDILQVKTKLENLFFWGVYWEDQD